MIQQRIFIFFISIFVAISTIAQETEVAKEVPEAQEDELTQEAEW